MLQDSEWIETRIPIKFYTYVIEWFIVVFFSSLRGMRAKVWKARTSSPLFNCKHYARSMEILYRKMWDLYENGKESDHVTST